MNDVVVRRLANLFRCMGVNNPVTVATCLLQWDALKHHVVENLKNNTDLDKTPEYGRKAPHELLYEYESAISMQPLDKDDIVNRTLMELKDKLDNAIAVEDYKAAAKIKTAIDKIKNRKLKN